MKYRYIYILLILLFPVRLRAQPAETIYQGTVIKSGYVDDASYGPFNIGFNFIFFGNSYSQFYVNSNGQVLFGTGSSSGTEAAIPTSGVPENFIAPFWDDLVVDGTGKILYTTIGASPNRRLIIQFNNMGFYGAPSLLGSFSVILNETSNIIQIQYRLIVLISSARAHGSSAAIGIENSDGTIGIQYLYHIAGDITSGKAISFTPSGPTYNLNSDATYEWLYLTTNSTLPEPGIPDLLSPPQDAVIGTDYTFSWSDAGNAASYSLLISTSSDLGGATIYSPGTSTSYNVTGLALNTTYYWGVFATNSTGTTWCQIQRFTTSSAPPLAAVPQTSWVELNQEKTIKLDYTGGDASAKKAVITTLPVTGQFYQYNAGIKGAQIISVPDTVTDTGRNVIYVANGTTGNGAGNFTFKIHDNSGDSPDAQVTVNVSPPGMPSLLYTGKATTYVEMQFDHIMADPAGKEGQFTITVNSTPVTISSLSLKTGDPYTIVATLASPILITDAVIISYTAGNITSSMGGLLASFSSQTVTLKAQTITFTISLAKKYSDSPFTLSSSASSGLGVTYSSSNLSVATISGNIATFHSVGSSDITVRQAGNGTWAPANYVRTLTVAKGDQTITFNALPVKTYGDADFPITATASSGLSVTYVSGNPAVATIAGNIVHMVASGSAIITASQAGNTLWNPASDVPQTLTVNKANQTITFSVLPSKVYGDADFVLSASASSGLSVVFASGNPAVVTVAGNVVHIVGAGTAVITALQAGNGNYNPATDVPQTLTVNPANQTITFSVLPVKVYGDADFTITATASSGLSVSFSSSDPAVATILGNVVHIVGAGTSVITASQAGDANYSAAPVVQQTLAVRNLAQTITFTDYPSRLLVQDSHTLAATSSGGITVLFESGNTSIATIAGNQVTGVAKGNVQIRAYNDGNQDYAPAEAFVTIEVYSTHKDIMYLFTPNNDGFNDLWELPELSTWGKCDVRVFNRWGKLVFADPDYHNEWDGMSDGNPVPEGAYYFIIKTENNGVVKGTVNIVR